MSTPYDVTLHFKHVDPSEVCRFRRSLEKAICLFILEGGGAENWQRRVQETLSIDYRAVPPEELARQNSAFHRALIEATGSPIWITLAAGLEDLYTRQVSGALERADRLLLNQIQQSHQLIYLALLKKDRAALDAAINLHYDLVDEQVN